MKKLFNLVGFFLMAVLLVSGLSCGSDDGHGSGRDVPVPPEEPPFILGVDPIAGQPPAEDPEGPEITGLESLPALDVVEQGGDFTMFFTSDLAGGDTITGAVLMLEGDDEYYLLDIVVVGNLVTLTFTVHPDFPDGDYPIQLALLNSEGVAGPYIRIIFHVAFVPTLEIVDLFPHATISTAEGRVVEPLNVGARVYFTKPVNFEDFTLGIEDPAGEPIPGKVQIMPGKLSASFMPDTLLEPNTQYIVKATLPDEGISWSNAFWTEKVTPLGDDAALAEGTVYKFIIAADNVVEPEAAKLIFGLIGQVIPPFLMMVTEADPVAGRFSAIGGLSEEDGDTLVQELDAPVVVFAEGSEFADPYFLSAPSDIAVTASALGYTLTIMMHDFTISGKLTQGAAGFASAALDLYLDAEELREIAAGYLPIPPEMDLCIAIEELVGMPVCNDAGHIIMHAENIEGSTVDSITELLDLVPENPLTGDTISASAGATLDVEGWIERNAEPYPDTGWKVELWATQDGATVGSFSPAPPVQVNPDGSFATQLTIDPGTLGTEDPLLIHMTCDNFPAADSWERVVEITVLE
jgi:hypothetical protein